MVGGAFSFGQLGARGGRTECPAITFARATLLVLASAFLALGVTLPLVRFERLWLFEDAPSLLGIVEDLWLGEERLLAAFVVLVSIVFPCAKLLLAQVTAIDRSAPPRWLAGLSKWSMTDVLLVALAIVAAKTSGLAEAVTEPGVWFYAGSAICAYAATALPTHARRARATADRADPSDGFGRPGEGA